MRTSPRYRSSRGSVFAFVVVSLVHATGAQAATWWWNSVTTGTWTNATLWSNAATGGSTGAGPANSTTTDVVVFNQTGVNGTVAALLSGDQSIGGITGTNTGATTIRSADSTTRTLSLGASGITVGAGAGAFTVGTTGSVVNVAISANQTWTNNSANMFAVNGGVSSSPSVTGTLTIAGSGSTTLAGSITNGSGTMALAKSGAGTLTLSATNGFTGTMAVSGGTLVLAGGLTGTMGQVTVTSAAMSIQSGSYATSAGIAVSTGTVTQTGGFVRLAGGNFMVVANSPSTTGLYTLTGGTITAAASGNRGIMVGQGTNSSGTFSMSGGLLDLTAGGAATLMLGRYDSTNSPANSTFVQTGGEARIGNLSIGGTGSTSGTAGNQILTLTGGTFTASAFPRLSAGDSNVATMTIGGSADVTLPAFPTARGSGATVTLFFNGGVLRPAAASAAYMGGLTNAYVQAGGATVNVASGNDITISQALLADGTSPGGGLTKQGVGTLTISGSSTYTGATTIAAGNLAVNATNAIPSSSVVTLGNAATTGTLTLGSFTNAIGGLAFGASGGTLRIQATSTSAAPLTAATGTMTLTGGTLDLAGSGSTAGLYRVLSAQSVSGAFASITGTSAAYQVIPSATSVDYQQRAVLGALTVTNPAVSIITGGFAAFTYMVANNALGGGASLAFTGSGGGLSNVNGSSSGAAAGGGTSGSVSGLVFTGTSVGAGQIATFTVNAPAAYGAVSATGTVSVNVLNHSLASFQATDTASKALNFGQYDPSSGLWTGGDGGNGSLAYSLFNIASNGFTNAQTAGLGLYDVVFTSGSNVFSTGIASYFGNLTSGSSNGYTASVASLGSLPEGTYQGVYTLKFRDQQDLSGATNTRDLTLTMNMVIVPEPGALALTGLGIALATWAARRRS